jgi:serine protease inhibitor
MHWVAEVSMLSCCSSDHNPILLTFRSNEEIQWQKCRSFWTKASWNTYKNYKLTVKKIWRAKVTVGDKWEAIRGKLQGYQHSLKKWVRKTTQYRDAYSAKDKRVGNYADELPRPESRS